MFKLFHIFGWSLHLHVYRTVPKRDPNADTLLIVFGTQPASKFEFKVGEKHGV